MTLPSLDSSLVPSTGLEEIVVIRSLSKLDRSSRHGSTGGGAVGVVTMSPDPQRPSLAGTIAMVTQLADQAERVAAGLLALREPEAAALVARLGGEASRASAALRELLEPRACLTDWYQVHRDMWVRYGDPGDLAAMIDHVTDAD